VKKRLRWHPVFALLAALTIFFGPVLFTGNSFFVRDLTFLFHPWKTLCSEMVQRGQVPLWDPYAYCGMPLLGNWQSAVFYPFSQFFYLFGFAAGLKAYHFTHLFLGGVFAYLFARSRGLQRGAASVCMFLFALNGYIVTRLEFLSHVGADIWIFALLLLAGRGPLPLGMAAAIAFSAGHQSFFLAALMLLVYAAVQKNDERKRMMISLGQASVLAAGLAACQLLPTAELAVRSMRLNGGLDAAVAMVYSVRPAALAALASPLLQTVSTAVGGVRMDWTTTFYIGIAGVILCLAGLYGRKDRRLLVWVAITGGAGIILSLGNSTPVYPWMYRHIPFLSTIRYPVQYMYLTVCAATVAAGLGAAKLRLGGVAGLVLAVELLCAGWGFQARVPDGYFNEKPASVTLLQQNVPGRFILSPGTEKNRMIPATTVTGAWEKARGCLYGLVCLPYHLANAYGYGEPLTIAPLEKAVQTAYEKETPKASLPLLRRLGVTNLVSRRMLPDTEGYLPPETAAIGMPLYIYGVKTPHTIAAMPDEPGGAVGVEYVSEQKARFMLPVVKGGMLLVRETWFPGWEFYSGGKKLSVTAWEGLFRACTVPAGDARVYQVYRPGAFLFGIIITMIFLIILTTGAARLMIRRKKNSPL
jgi:hypothetical protein